jgi:3-deoxy-D-manno-octulosonic-acid transferase
MISYFLRPILRSISLFLMQSDEDARRLKVLGADPDRIKVSGSAKFDLSSVDNGAVEKARAILEKAGMNNSTILLGGSTWPGEESLLLKLFGRIKSKFSSLKLVIVPRHVERSAEVESEIRAAGYSFARRSRIDKEPAGSPDVLLVDTTGELKHFYAAAELTFVGKSLCARGGQNLIEPAACGKAVIVGPHMGNFQSVTDDFLAAGGLVQVHGEDGLEREIVRLLSDDKERCAIGERAGKLVAARRGVIPRNAEDIVRLIELPQKS